MLSLFPISSKIKIQKEEYQMTNLDRLKMEIKGIDYPDTELSIYLEENGLDPSVPYDPQSKTQKKKIYMTAVDILNSIANQPNLMKSYKTDDLTISQFAESIQNRIDQLERKIRMMQDDEMVESSFFWFFN